MELLLGQILVALSAVIAALITGAFAFFNLVVAKETKVSEFRQAWIDSLRVEISTYISRLHAVSNLGRYIHERPVEDKYNPELLRERSRMYEEALSAYNSIRLRINPNETVKEACQLNGAFLNALNTSHRFYEAGHTEALDENLERLSAAAAPLLKFEWDRVRKGEPAYGRAKVTSLVIVGVAGIGALSFLVLAALQMPLLHATPTTPRQSPASQPPSTPSGSLTPKQTTPSPAEPAKK